MGCYLTAQVCLNGHVIIDNIEHNSNLCEKFCHICGAETICECLNCHTPIRGKYYVSGITAVGFGYDPAPAYCYNCGKPFPWTENALEATRIALDEADELKAEDREKLKNSLPDLLAETPQTNLAVTRLKKVFLYAGKFTKDVVLNFVNSFACDAVKSQLGL